jgi:hypothetical protein
MRPSGQEPGGIKISSETQLPRWKAIFDIHVGRTFLLRHALSTDSLFVNLNVAESLDEATDFLYIGLTRKVNRMEVDTQAPTEWNALRAQTEWIKRGSPFASLATVSLLTS